MKIDFDAVYYEPNIEEYDLGKMLKSKYGHLPWIPVESHNRIPELSSSCNKEFPSLKKTFDHRNAENSQIRSEPKGVRLAGPLYLLGLPRHVPLLLFGMQLQQVLLSSIVCQSGANDGKAFGDRYQKSFASSFRNRQQQRFGVGKHHHGKSRLDRRELCSEKPRILDFSYEIRCGKAASFFGPQRENHIPNERQSGRNHPKN